MGESVNNSLNPSIIRALHIANLLESSYRYSNRDKGLTILAFPCNNFLGQEPLDSEGLKGLKASRGILYEMMGKLECENGSKTHPLFQYLRQSKSGGILGHQLKWNFTKFLCNENGVTVKRSGPTDTPLSMEADIVKLLGL